MLVYQRVSKVGLHLFPTPIFVNLTQGDLSSTPANKC